MFRRVDGVLVVGRIRERYVTVLMLAFVGIYVVASLDFLGHVSIPPPKRMIQSVTNAAENCRASGGVKCFGVNSELKTAHPCSGMNKGAPFVEVNRRLVERFFGLRVEQVHVIHVDDDIHPMTDGRGCPRVHTRDEGFSALFQVNDLFVAHLFNHIDVRLEL